MKDGSTPLPLIPLMVVNFQNNSQIGWANNTIQTQILPEHMGMQTTVKSQEFMAICNTVPSQPNPSQIYQTPTASFIQAARDMDPTPSYPVPHGSMLEAMQAVNSTSPTFTRACTLTPSVTSLSSPIEGQPSTGELKSLMGSQGNSPDKPIILLSTNQSLTPPSGALFPTSSEMGFPTLPTPS